MLALLHRFQCKFTLDEIRGMRWEDDYIHQMHTVLFLLKACQAPSFSPEPQETPMFQSSIWCWRQAHSGVPKQKTLGVFTPFREANMQMDRVKLATLLKESCTAKSLANCCLRPLASGVAFAPSADLPLCSCRDIYIPAPARCTLL